MALIVEPTHPYTNQQLQIDNPGRWSALFPLIRPSTQRESTASGQLIVLDTALTASKNVLIVAIGTAGNISSRTLSDSHLAAFTTEQPEKSSVKSEEVLRILKDRSFPVENGVVVVRFGQKRDLRVTSGLLELVVDGELAVDHVLSLLNTSEAEVKASFDKTQSLLEQFVKSVVSSPSHFHPEKGGNGPKVVHATGTDELKSAKAAIGKALQHLLSSKQEFSKKLVVSVHYSDINGLSRLEINIIAHEIYLYLTNQGLSPRITHSTILDHQSHARGFAISLCPLDPSFLSPQAASTATISSTTTSVSPTTTSKSSPGTSTLKFSSSGIRKIITTGCETVIKAEPTITEYDTIVGDGDCGYTLRDGATQVMKFISSTTDADLSSSLSSTLTALVDDLEVNMGGTSGALYCIFISALAQELNVASTLAQALKGALEQLLKYTTARLGDRTCLDCLIPFVDTLLQIGDKQQALEEARKGVDGTMKMEARVGRSSYLDESATRGVPDPGAYGLLKLLEGMIGAA